MALFAVSAGILFIIVAIVYWVEPAKSLPGFFPGHEAGSSHHHVKHGIAAFLVGLACLVFAWFRTGPKRTTRRRDPAALISYRQAIVLGLLQGVLRSSSRSRASGTA